MNIFGWTKTELADALRAEGIPRFRADQIIRWMYQRGAVSFDVMDNLPKVLRAQLAERFSIERPQVGARLTSADGGDGAHAPSLRQQCLCLDAGGLPHGLCILRVDAARSGA